jgi:hypothetical protein
MKNTTTININKGTNGRNYNTRSDKKLIKHKYGDVVCGSK